ncbi:tripartite tricarboxylate transporter substrate binding protein [Variovorax sp. WS11]|nr:tripartite tricarboxylate transporter substrate binding protein [Variovorax sp. WS11]
MLSGAALLALTPAHSQVHAGSYPSMPIRIVLPTPAGGTHDAMARLIGQRLSLALKQPVVVESKPGATGMLATSYVAKAPADGYTLLFGQASVVQNTVLRSRTSYQLRDLAPVSLVVLFPVALAVKANSPVKSVADLVELSKDPQRNVSVASWGTGSTGHIIVEAIKQQSGAKLTHVAYKGEAEPFSDLVGGVITAATGSAGYYIPQSDKTRILAVSSTKRLKSLPDIPTFEQAGYSSANLSGWGGFFLPANTPAPIVAKLSQEIRKIVAEPEIAERIRSFDFEPVGSSSEEFAKFIQQDISKWSEVVKKGNLSLD